MKKIDIRTEWKNHCKEIQVPFEVIETINPYDDTTLFCISGMQKYKKWFSDKSLGYKTVSNIQSCLRLNDLDEIGDGSHLLYFNMIGYFSFRELTVESTIFVWMDFIQNKLGLKVDWVTIHPDKMEEWSKFYDKYNVEVRPDGECIWSDGDIGGYCTEFYSGGLEIGNIVNPLGDCIDCGFGQDRIDFLVNGTTKTKEDILIETILKIIESGYIPGSQKQGYVLRKLLRLVVRQGLTIDHPFFYLEKERQEKLSSKYLKLKDRFKDKPKEWWLDTHGIDTEDYK